MNLCQNCGTENSESVATCGRCGVALALSPTESISSEFAEDQAKLPKPSSGLRGFAPGSLIGDRYRVISLLGRGGMGEVYAADDLKLGQRVALKFLPAERLKSSSWREQFYAEVRNARQVSHPNVCRMYDVGESDGRLFLSMEFVDGEDLASLLRRIGRLPDDKAIEVAQQLCAGLAAAHSAGVLHRDLKPSNVMLDGKGRARITDFGLAIAAADAAGEKPAGTPGYMAPELMNGGAPTVQSDLYALGLVLYEVFTGKRAFDAPNVAELYRKQSETNPTPPSSLVKNLDPAVERAILRCLDRDPGQRPRSAHGVAAALPGGDPLAAALAAGETPSPEMVAAAGPQGALRPAVAWACLATAVVLIFGTSIFVSPRNTNWGLALMNKSPEVLADRAQELAKKLGYPAAVDREFWIGPERAYIAYVEHHPPDKDKPSKVWQRSSEQAWPSSVAFWYRQSPTWMTPGIDNAGGPPHVTESQPPYETSGMVALKLDTQGKLLFLRAVPPQVEAEAPRIEPDWNVLFAEAGLDKTRFTAAASKWAPPEIFDSRADWEGHLADHPDLPLHVTAAAYHGVPVYFQVIAPWDQAWRSEPDHSGASGGAPAAVWVSLLIGYLLVGGFFARWNLRRGRGDAKGALRLAGFTTLTFCAWALCTYHLVPQAHYIVLQFIELGIPLLFGLLSWIGYMAVEPYVRRSWPKLMVSWQRLLSGRFRDPLVGRDMLLGVLAGSAVGAVLLSYNALLVIPRLGTWEATPVDPAFGQGLSSAVGSTISQPALNCLLTIIFLAILSIMTGILRRRWLGLAALGLINLALNFPTNRWDLAYSVVFVLVFLAVLVRVGLIGSVCFSIAGVTLGASPPLVLTQWYAGRAMIALLLPVGLVVYGFYVSLGGQPMFGKALEAD